MEINNKIKVFKLKDLPEMLKGNDKSILINAPLRNHKAIRRIVAPYANRWYTNSYFELKNKERIILTFANTKEEVFKHAGLEYNEIWYLETQFIQPFAYEYLKAGIRCEVDKDGNKQST